MGNRASAALEAPEKSSEGQLEVSVSGEEAPAFTPCSVPMVVGRPGGLNCTLLACTLLWTLQHGRESWAATREAGWDAVRFAGLCPTSCGWKQSGSWGSRTGTRGIPAEALEGGTVFSSSQCLVNVE